jgi:hypothetical protein
MLPRVPLPLPFADPLTVAQLIKPVALGLYLWIR